MSPAGLGPRSRTRACGLREGCRRGWAMWRCERGWVWEARGMALCGGRAGAARPTGPGPRGVGAAGSLPSSLLSPCLSVVL